MTNKDGAPGKPGSSTQDAPIARDGPSDGKYATRNAIEGSSAQQQGDFARPIDNKSPTNVGFEHNVVDGSLRQDSSALMLDEAAIGAEDKIVDAMHRDVSDRPTAATDGKLQAKHPAQSVSHKSGKRNNSSRAKPPKTPAKYAALDLGTNNCRLLIAEPKEQGFRIVDSFSRIVRLGEGISKNNRLSDDACDRAISALRVCWNKLKYHKVENVRLIATEACRSAENGSAFLRRVTDEIGLELEIIDQETEARLAVAGCSSLVEPRSDGVVLFDIGGGSSEIVWLDRRGRRKRNRLGGTLRAWDSLSVGVVTLSERHDGKNVTRQSFEAMVQEVQDLLQHFPKRRELQQALSRGRHHLLGTSGTVTTLAGIHLGLRRYDRRRVDGMWMSNDEAALMIERLLELDYEGRVRHPCIGPDRADLVLPGCAIFEAIRREFTCDQLRIADRGLREGILVEQMSKDGHGLGRAKSRSAPWRRKRPKSGPKSKAQPGINTGEKSDER